MKTKLTFYDKDDKLVRKLIVDHMKWETKIWFEQSQDVHFKRHPMGTIKREEIKECETATQPNG